MGDDSALGLWVSSSAVYSVEPTEDTSEATLALARGPPSGPGTRVCPPGFPGAVTVGSPDGMGGTEVCDLGCAVIGEERSARFDVSGARRLPGAAAASGELIWWLMLATAALPHHRAV